MKNQNNGNFPNNTMFLLNLKKIVETRKIVNIVPKENCVMLYEDKKSIPWKISKTNGEIIYQAAYSEKDLILLQKKYGIGLNTINHSSNTGQSRIRTCANTKLTTLKKY